MINFKMSVTEDYEKLVPFFIENGLEFAGDGSVPPGLVKCWEITEKTESGNEKLIGGFVLAKRDGEFIVDGIAIAPEYRKLDLGKVLLQKGLDEVSISGGEKVFLVAKAPEFFRKYGFVTVPKEEAPNFFECLTCEQFGVSCHPEIMRCDL